MGWCAVVALSLAETRSSKLDDMYTQMQAQLRELTERSNGKL